MNNTEMMMERIAKELTRIADAMEENNRLMQIYLKSLPQEQSCQDAPNALPADSII